MKHTELSFLLFLSRLKPGFYFSYLRSFVLIASIPTSLNSFPLCFLAFLLFEKSHLEYSWRPGLGEESSLNTLCVNLNLSAHFKGYLLRPQWQA